MRHNFRHNRVNRGIPGQLRPKVQTLPRQPSSRASQAIYCASVSSNLRCVSANVDLTLGSVSRNVRRKQPSIARLPYFDCAPLQLGL
jgi:hypothetical protein